MLSRLSRTSLRAAAPLGRSTFAALSVQSRNFASDEYGINVFKGAVADKYLSKHGLSGATLEDYTWTTKHADAVAQGVLDWALDNGATVFCHWFQPLGAGGVRPGQSGQVQNSFIDFAKDGSFSYKFDGKALLKGETDGSSYPSGGLRATHTAGGYTVLDPSSPIFLRGDTIFIPSAFVSFYGHALDEKTPLLRAQKAVSREGKRLLKHLGVDVSGVQANIGLEQEYFLVPREAFYSRTDLQMTGRTVMGKLAPRGQEMCDHYMAPLNQVAMAYNQEVQDECFKMGIPLRTRHREVAPNQYEFAPLFGSASTQTDQNLMVMQVMEEVAARHGLACLLQEKPFMGINGSGKHNNWSLGTTCGIQLFCPEALGAAAGPLAFPVVMAAIVRAIDQHGDLMRAAIACPGNDFRLGACEAPPAIISTYLGDDMTQYLEDFANGDVKEYKPAVKTMDIGVDHIAPFSLPAEDRNRTSPFPYGGKRFEFRAVGSSQNVSLVNTALMTMAAEAFAAFSDAIEAGQSPSDVAAEALKSHMKCIFNGNGYSEEWPEEAVKRGVWRIDSGVESINRLRDPKNIDLFSKMGVLSEEETVARALVLFDHYSGQVEMEALSMVDMMKQGVIPAAAQAGLDTADIEDAVSSVEGKLGSMHDAADEYAKATIARELRLETMEKAREICDGVEAVVPRDMWPFATYKDLLFLDFNQDADHN